MKKQNYVKNLMLFSTFMTACALAIFYYIAIHKAEFDVYTISKNHLVQKAEERINYLNMFFRNYKNFTYTLQLPAKKYLLGEYSQTTIESTFSRLITNLDSLSQLRIMDKNFNEVVKVSHEENSSSKTLENNIKIWSLKEKINKKHRDYFKYFENLQENELGISFIDNNVEFGKTEPKPVVRLSYKIYDNHQAIGYVIVNVALENFIKELIDTTLYDVWFIDKKGNLLIYNDPEYQILGQVDITKYKTLQDIYPFKSLDKKYNFLNSYTLAVHLDGYNKEQGLYLVLHTKYGHHILNDWENLIVLIILSLFILSLLISYIFGTHINKLSNTYLHNLLFDRNTNLPNKAQLLEDLSENSNQVLALIAIDNMKQLTAVYGIDLTDTLIKQFANDVLDKTMRLNFSKFYRIEHALFAATYTFNNISELTNVIQKLHDRIEQKEFICAEDHCSIYFSITIGVSDPYHVLDGKNELQEATLALEKATEQSTSHEIYNINNDIQKINSQEALHNIGIIKKALKENLVTPYAQAIVDKTGRVEKYEALIRISNNGDVYMPYQFLKIAKVSKHYYQLSKLMIENVFKVMSNDTYSCSINVSTFDIRDKNFTPFLLKLIKKYNLSNRLTIEILESEHTEQVQQLKDFLTIMKSQGIKIAIDDFGAGHSNLERILNLAEYIDYLKIDGSLIQNILTDHKSQILLKSIVSFSKELNFKTIAEFVESEEIFQYLKKLEIDYFQGYYFSEPIPIENITS